MSELEWGLKLEFRVGVPRFASGNRRDMFINRRTGRWFPRPSLDVQNFRKHIQAALRQATSQIAASNPQLPRFPISGVDVRLDLYFGFAPDDDGSYRRMKLTDWDNLRKTTQDAFQAVVLANDNRIAEGFTAQFMLPGGTTNDFIIAQIWRSGYRTSTQMEQLIAAMGPAYPWRPQDEAERSGLVKLPGRKIITLDELAAARKREKHLTPEH